MKTLMPKKLISAILATAVLSVAPIYASAYDIIDTEENIVLPISDLPEMIDREEAISRGHIQRLKSEEPDLHSVVFLNSDGTKSLYMFASPVKYVANDGTVKDKRTQLNQTLTNFSSTDNDVNVNISRISSNGASISNENETVTMIPAGSGNNKIGLLSNNSAMFNEVFGNDTALYYTPLLSGVKAGIVLKSYGGQNEFTFDITANGLLPITTENGLICLNNSDGEAIFEIGTFVATDANGNHFESEMILSGNTASGFKITSEVDESFLESENTAYPVIIEQSISLNTSSAIDDALVYSGKPTRTYGSYKYNNIGYLDSSYKIGRLLVRFPGLLSNPTFLSLSEMEIRNAEFYMYTASGANFVSYLGSYLQDEYTTWSESTLTWRDLISQAPLSSVTNLTSATVSDSAAQKTTINVTNACRMWLSNPSIINGGLLLRCFDETADYFCRDFCSTEYADLNNGNLMPYINITYGSLSYSTVNFNVYYDAAFQAMARSLFPNVSVYTAVRNRVNSILDGIADVYEERFAIRFNINVISSPILTSIDECNNKNSNGICQCFADCEDHHTNAYNVMESLPLGNNTALTLFFTANNTCSFDGDVCNDDYVSGLANSNLLKAAIFCTDMGVTPYNELYTKMAVAHEIGHFFDVDDHYKGFAQPPGSDRNCIWGWDCSEEITMSNLSMCTYCTNIIYNNYNRFS